MISENFWPFMDHEKEFDRTDKLNSGRSCSYMFMVGRSVIERLPVKMGLQQGCVMPPRLFVIYGR